MPRTIIDPKLAQAIAQDIADMEGEELKEKRMDNKKQEDGKKSVQVEAKAGCEDCNNTGLDGAGAGAQRCRSCDGSPFGLRPEVQVDQEEAEG